MILKENHNDWGMSIMYLQRHDIFFIIGLYIGQLYNMYWVYRQIWQPWYDDHAMCWRWGCRRSVVTQWRRFTSRNLVNVGPGNGLPDCSAQAATRSYAILYFILDRPMTTNSSDNGIKMQITGIYKSVFKNNRWTQGPFVQISINWYNETPVHIPLSICISHYF